MLVVFSKFILPKIVGVLLVAVTSKPNPLVFLMSMEMIKSVFAGTTGVGIETGSIAHVDGLLHLNIISGPEPSLLELPRYPTVFNLEMGNKFVPPICIPSTLFVASCSAKALI